MKETFEEAPLPADTDLKGLQQAIWATTKACIESYEARPVVINRELQSLYATARRTQRIGDPTLLHEAISGLSRATRAHLEQQLVDVFATRLGCSSDLTSLSSEQVIAVLQSGRRRIGGKERKDGSLTRRRYEPKLRLWPVKGRPPNAAFQQGLVHLQVDWLIHCGTEPRRTMQPVEEQPFHNFVVWWLKKIEAEGIDAYGLFRETQKLRNVGLKRTRQRLSPEDR
jgi:hypothetical protein